jgi:N4-gp56 family major capsid protein
LVGDGVAGDRTLEGNEEALDSDDMVIQIDQLRHANRHKGKMADQRSVVEFRNNSKNKLAYWLADRLDQMQFLALSGVAFSNTNRGATRTGSDLINLDFAGDVTAPSTNRHFRWDATNGLEAGATASVEITDLPSWSMLVEMKAKAEESYIKPMRMKDGIAFWHVFMTPYAVAQLKQDADFLANVRNAAPRSDSNILFKGTNTIMVDGMAIHSHRHVFNNQDAGSGNYWGAGSNVEGCRVLMCGAQALAVADIGDAEWHHSIYSGTDEDFGVIAVDVAQKPVART